MVSLNRNLIGVGGRERWQPDLWPAACNCDYKLQLSGSESDTLCDPDKLEPFVRTL